MSITKDGVWIRPSKTPEEVGPLVQTWIDIALRNPWIAEEREPTYFGEPAISADDFVVYDDPEKMAATMVKGNWNTGTAFVYHDQCWINQSMGGAEMLVIKQDVPFESMTVMAIAGVSRESDYEPATLHRLVEMIQAIDKATVEECRTWEYGKHLPSGYYV